VSQEDKHHIVCQYCGKEFVSMDEFKIHVEQVHTSSDSFHWIQSHWTSVWL